VARLPNVRHRHQVHPFVDFCAVCGASPVHPDSDCLGQRPPTRNDLLHVDIFYDLVPVAPGQPTRSSSFLHDSSSYSTCNTTRFTSAVTACPEHTDHLDCCWHAAYRGY